jgi:hypothetical protein
MVAYDFEWDCHYRDSGNNLAQELNDMGSLILYRHLRYLDGSFPPICDVSSVWN